MKMIQTSTSQALRPGGIKKATAKVRKQVAKQARIPPKQKLHGRSNFQTLKSVNSLVNLDYVLTLRTMPRQTIIS